MTALPIAAGAPIVPLAAALTPSGLLGAGVAMNVVWNGKVGCARHHNPKLAVSSCGGMIIDDVLAQRPADALCQPPCTWPRRSSD
jgi:hypothetical protein